MKILILGASGPLGRHLVGAALERGHEVTAFVRDPAKLPRRHDRLRVAIGDALDAQSLDAAMDGQEAIVSSLGVGLSLRSGGLIGAAMPAILAAMERRSLRRLVAVSAFGVGHTREDAPLLPRIVFRTLLRDIYADKNAGDDALKRSAFDWTIVAPVRLTDGPRTGKARAGERLRLAALPSVSRADVAQFVLDEIERPRHLRRVVVVAGS